MLRPFIASALLAGLCFAGNSLTESKAIVFGFYNKPDQYLTLAERMTKRGLEVEICSDYCDLYVLPSKADAAVLWDAIVLTKAFLSDAAADRAFSDKNMTYARKVLARVVTPVCGSIGDERRKARCALQEVSIGTKLRRAAVTYDEGNRCEAFASFKEPYRVSGAKCARMK